MNQNINRQQFLTGDFKGERSPKRPPWSLKEESFIERCNGCGTCWQQCPEDILRKGRGNYPIIDFSERECTLCHHCADVCSTNAIYYNSSMPPWLVEIKVNKTCLAKQGVVCVVCEEQCETQAINLVYQVGKVSQIEIDESCCNGCGACETPCPTHAIQIKREQFFVLTNSTKEDVL